MRSSSGVPTFGMQQRSEHRDFYIRDQRARPPETRPHRHHYFQIQVNLGGDTVQHIGDVQRPFPCGAVAFILPHRVHLIPHPPDGDFVVINFDQQFLLPQLQCSPLELEDVSLIRAAELAPFLHQERLDFIFEGQDFDQVRTLLARMRDLDSQRQFGAREYLKGCLLQLIGMACVQYAEPLKALADDNVNQTSRRQALARVNEYIRKHLSDPDLSVNSAAAANALSPDYLVYWLRKEAGATFAEAVFEQRMFKARSLLVGSAHPVGDIARQCGFADEAYFSRRFRQTHGLPPGQYRRREREQQ
jgi:AraC-like DNA-binding protein